MELFYILLVLLVVTRAFGALAVRAGQPELVGQLVSGIVLGAGLFDRPDPPPPVIAHMFSAVVIMAVVTTLVPPIALRFLLRDDSSPEREVPSDG